MKKILLLCFSLLLLISGCQNKKTFKTTKNNAFEETLNQLLVDIISPDDFGINYSFINPEAYNISPKPYVLGFSSLDDYESWIQSAKQIVQELASFSDAQLTLEQQLDKQVLIFALNNDIAMAPYYDFQIGSSVIGFSRAFMGSLPAYLETYTFRTKQDVLGYFNFLETLPDYITKYIDLEFMRQRNGTGFGQEEIDRIIDVSETTYQEAISDSFYLINHFNQVIDDVAFLNVNEKEEAKARNKELLQNELATSYRLIIDEFSLIDAKESLGLSHKPNGKEYYEQLLQQETGKESTIEEIRELLDEKEKEAILYFMVNADTLAQLESDVINNQFGNFNNQDELMKSLLDHYESDYPKIEMPSTVLRTVDESIKDSSSPAFYFSPPIDYDLSEPQVIYINGEFDNGSYPIYAHEGVPGHMYQFNYFLSLTDMHPVRSFFTFISNAEGWANYTEKYTVKYVKDAQFTEFYNYYMMYLEIFHIRLDIGIHYDGWTFDDYANFYADQFFLEIEDPELLAELKESYLQIVHTPAAYPTYYLSSLYIQQMKDHALRELDELYQDIDFHQALLRVGSAPMSIMEESVNDYISETLNK